MMAMKENSRSAGVARSDVVCVGECSGSDVIGGAGVTEVMSSVKPE